MKGHTMRVIGSVGLVFAAVLAQATPVLAQTAAMLPAQHDVKASGAQHTEAMGMVYETLVEQGIQVVADETAVEKKLIEKGLYAECQSASSCAPKIARWLGVDFVASVVVWTEQSAQKRPQSVAVGLITPEGTSHNGAAAVHEGNLREATRQATLKALQERQAKELGWLEVTSEPKGASVELDGKVSGKTPYKRRVALGKHRLKVSLSGHESHTEEVNVQKKGTASAHVTLTEGQEASSDWWWKYGAPITLAGVGLAGLLVLGGVALFATGCDSEYPSGACRDESELDTTSAVIWGSISGALLVVGGGWLVWNLTQDSDDDAGQGTSAQLRLTPTGAFVQGRF